MKFFFLFRFVKKRDFDRFFYCVVCMFLLYCAPWLRLTQTDLDNKFHAATMPKIELYTAAKLLLSNTVWLCCFIYDKTLNKILFRLSAVVDALVFMCARRLFEL